jgi:receptor protein-tyrosine kinase
MDRPIKAIKNQWPLILTMAILGLIAAGVSTAMRAPLYTARIMFFISANPSEDNQTAYEGSLMAQQRGASYDELLMSPTVGEAVAGRLGLQIQPEEFTRKLSVEQTASSVILRVAVEDSSPESAARIANAIGEVFPRLVDQLERPLTPPNAPAAVTVRLVEPADVPFRPSSLGLRVTLPLGVMAGLLVGLIGATARESFMSRKDSDLGAPTLGADSNDRVAVPTDSTIGRLTSASRPFVDDGSGPS